MKGGRGHDHGFLNLGDDRANLADGHNEADHIEEIFGGHGEDRCTVDNHRGDRVQGCELVRVVNEDGSRISFRPNADASNTPVGVRITAKMPNDPTGPG